MGKRERKVSQVHQVNVSVTPLLEQITLHLEATLNGVILIKSLR